MISFSYLLISLNCLLWRRLIHDLWRLNNGKTYCEIDSQITAHGRTTDQMIYLPSSSILIFVLHFSILPCNHPIGQWTFSSLSLLYSLAKLFSSHKKAACFLFFENIMHRMSFNYKEENSLEVERKERKERNATVQKRT